MKSQLSSHEWTWHRERQRSAPVMLMLLVLLGGATASAGQTPVLERVVLGDHLGAPVVWLPDGIGSGLFARRVAQGARVPLVFEALSTVSAGAPLTRFDLTGLTVRAALDALVTAEPRYEWRLIGDTVVVRPAGAWADRGHPLHGPAGSEVPGEEPLAEALSRVVGVTQAPDLAALASRVDGGRRVRSTTGALPVLERVAQLAAESDLFIQVTEADASAGAGLDVATWEGQSYRITGRGRSTVSVETSR